MRGAAVAVIAVGAAVAAACGGGAARPVEVGNRGAAELDEACTGGDELTAHLDDDGQLDRVRLAPSAQAVTCLEIRATKAPRLVCSESARPVLPQVETSDGEPEEVGVVACDPMGAAVSAFGRDRFAVMVGDAAPTRTGLRLSGGDATVAIVWRRGRWTWIEMGF